MSFESRNRAFLERYDPDLLKEIQSVSQTRVQVQPARKQGLGMSLAGHWIHSKYDPIKEAAKVAMGEAASAHVHFGFGLGFFLEADASQPEAKTLVYEPNPELVLAALEHRDLEFLLTAGNARVCCSPARFKKLLPGILQTGEEPKLVESPFHVKAYPQHRQFFQQVVRESIYSKDLAVRSMVKHMPLFTESALRNLNAITSLPGVEALAGALAGKPCVIVAPGPSLERVLPDLAAYAEQLVIIAMARTVRPLESFGIRPHFMVHNEPQPYYRIISGCSNLDRTAFVLAEQVEPIFFQRPGDRTFVFRNPGNQAGLWLSEQFPELERAQLPSGGSVANDAFSFALLLDCNPIVLVGQDLALRGESYYAHSPWNKKFEHNDASKRPVPAYHGGQVITLNNYLAFLLWFQDEARRLKEEQPHRVLINATAGGARIGGFRQNSFRETLHRYCTEPVDVEPFIREAAIMVPGIEPEHIKVLLGDARRRIRGLIQLGRRARELEKNLKRRLNRSEDEQGIQRLFRKIDEMRDTYMDLNNGFRVITGYLQADLHQITALKKERENKRPVDPIQMLQYDRETELTLWSQTVAATAGAAKKLDVLLEELVRDRVGENHK